MSALVLEQWHFLLDVAHLINYCVDEGWVATGGELHRTIEQQRLYVQQGKSKTMNSNHLRRCAIDLNFFKGGKLIYDKAELQAVGDYWESLNPKNSWGGNWTSFLDVPHFERRP